MKSKKILLQALDAEDDYDDLGDEGSMERGQGPYYDPHVVHDEGYFKRIQHASKHQNNKRGYNPLKVENLVGDPERVLKVKCIITMFKRIKIVNYREKDHPTTQEYHRHNSAIGNVPH